MEAQIFFHPAGLYSFQGEGGWRWTEAFTSPAGLRMARTKRLSNRSVLQMSSRADQWPRMISRWCWAPPLMSTLADHEFSNPCPIFSLPYLSLLPYFFNYFLNYFCLSVGNLKVRNVGRTEIHFLDSLVYLIPKQNVCITVKKISVTSLTPLL